MSPDNAIKAAEAVREMRRLDEIIDTASSYSVIGINLTQADADDYRERSGVQLRPSNQSSGTLGSIGFPKDLEGAMTEAFMAWLNARYEAAKAEAKGCGVEID